VPEGARGRFQQLAAALNPGSPWARSAIGRQPGPELAAYSGPEDLGVDQLNSSHSRNTHRKGDVAWNSVAARLPT
jgi:hypothetical protein